MKKRILIGVLAFLVLGGTCLFVYINKVFLPVKLKEIILTKSQETLGRKVTFDKIDYHFLQGIVVDNLTMYDKDAAATPFIHIEQARFNVLITPIFRQKKIVIPSLIITHPQINAVRQDATTWNFSDLLTKRTPTKKGPLSVFLGGLTIDKGQLEVIDNSTETPITEKFQNIDLKAELSLKSGVKFQFHTQVPNGAPLEASGHFDLFKKILTAEVKVQKFDPFKYVKMFNDNPLFIHRAGTIETADLKIKTNGPNLELSGDLTVANADVTVQTDKIVQAELISAHNLHLFRKNNTNQITGNCNFKNGKLTLANGKSFAGDLTGENLDMTLGNKAADIKGKLDVLNAHFELGENRLVQGHLSAKQFAFKRKDNVFGIKSDLLAQETDLRWENSDFKGTLSSPQIIWTSNNGALDANGQLEVQAANFNIADKTKIQGNLKTPETSLTFKDKKLNIKTAFLLENAIVDLGEGKTISGILKGENTTISLADGILTADGHLQVTQGHLTLAQNREFIGDPSIDFKLNRTLNSESPLIYSGSMILENGTLKGLPRVGEVQGISGTITFANNKIYSELLRLRTLDTDMVLSGTLQNFKDPDLDINASMSDVDLEKVKPYFAEQLAKYQLSPSGQADLKLRYNGPMDDAKSAHIKFTADLKDATLTGEKLPAPISRISGRVNYSSQSTSWEGLSGVFKDKKYTLNGQWISADSPFLETTVESPEVNLTAKIQSKNAGVYKILSLKGKYYDSSFDVKGNFNIADGNPVVNLSSHVDLNLKNLAVLMPKAQSYRPLGTIALDANLIGNVKDWRHCQLNATGSSESISLNGFQFTKVSLKLEHGRFPTSQVDIAALFYNGALQMTSFIDPQRNDVPLTVSGTLKNADLALFAQDLNKGKTKEVSLKGALLLDFNWEGPLARLDKWKGRGSAAINDGQIFKFNLLKGIWRTLLIPELEDIVFTQAHTNFEIRNKRLVTNDLVLNSSAVDLSAKGWIDFDQNLNMNVSPNFKELAILQSASLKKGPTALLAKAQEYFNIKISGTLKKPEYTVSTQPVKAIEKTTGSLIEGVQGVLEDIINN